MTGSFASSSASSRHHSGHDVIDRAHAIAAFSRSSRLLDLSGRSVLVALDGSSCAAGAARIAQLLADKCHAVIHAVSVVDTRSAAVPPPLDIALGMANDAVAPTIHAEQVEAVRNEVAVATGKRPDWPIRIMLGTPAAAIVQEAHRAGAVLIILGLRRHGRLDRAVHDETALNVMRHASCPVFGVTEGAQSLPTRVLAAMDFSQESLLAARAAQSIAADHATIVLAYVSSPSVMALEDGEALIHELGVGAAFTRVADELRKENITFDHVVLHQAVQRSAAASLLEYADAVECDLLAAGSVQRGRLDRWLMGSVSTELVRDGRRSVLIFPPERTRSS